MIKRERYMQQIRPFIGNELIKVLTGIRRSGKSVMLVRQPRCMKNCQHVLLEFLGRAFCFLTRYRK